MSHKTGSYLRFAWIELEQATKPLDVLSPPPSQAEEEEHSRAYRSFNDRLVQVLDGPDVQEIMAFIAQRLEDLELRSIERARKRNNGERTTARALGEADGFKAARSFVEEIYGFVREIQN